MPHCHPHISPVTMPVCPAPGSLVTRRTGSVCPHLPGGGCWKGLAELINLAEAVPPLALNPGPLAPHPKVRASSLAGRQAPGLYHHSSPQPPGKVPAPSRFTQGVLGLGGTGGGASSPSRRSCRACHQLGAQARHGGAQHDLCPHLLRPDSQRTAFHWHSRGSPASPCQGLASPSLPLDPFRKRMGNV